MLLTVICHFLTLRRFTKGRTAALAFGLAVGGCSEALAQDPSPEKFSPGLSEEDLLEVIDDEIASETMAEMLSWLREHPVDLNSAWRDELLAIPGMRDEDADAILRAREKEVEFQSVVDLRQLPGGAELIERILPYVFVGSRRPVTPSKRIPLVVLTSRLSGFLPGTTRSSDPDILGAPVRSLSRLSVRFSDRLRAGVLFEKDSGERWNDGFVSGYVSFRGNGVLEQLILGDFNVDAGQGLVLWRAGDGWGGGTGGAIRRSGGRLLPYHMSDESGFLRGAAVVLKTRLSPLQVRCVLLLSRTPLAANVNDKGVVTSFYSSGLYRTDAELEKRGIVHEVLAGTRVEANLRGRGAIGVTFYRSSFGRVVQPGSGFGFSGERSQVVGTDASLVLGPARLFGEIAKSEGGGTGWIAGATMPVDTTGKLSIAWRDYSIAFNNPHARAYGLQSITTNERGVSIGWLMSLVPGVVLRGHADHCKIPGSTYTSILPRTSSDMMVEVTALPASGIRLGFALRMRRTEVMQAVTGLSTGPTRVQGTFDRNSARITGRLELAPHLESRIRIEHVESRSSVSSKTEKGTMLSQAFRYNTGRVECECGAAFFESESYNARLYDYEGNLHGAVQSPALSGKGSRWHILFCWGSFPWVRLAAKYAVSVVERSPIARELGVQAEFRF